VRDIGLGRRVGVLSLEVIDIPLRWEKMVEAGRKEITTG